MAKTELVYLGLTEGQMLLFLGCTPEDAGKHLELDIVNCDSCKAECYMPGFAVREAKDGSWRRLCLTCCSKDVERERANGSNIALLRVKDPAESEDEA